MNRLKLTILFALVFLVSIMVGPVQATGKGSFVAIYNSGRALVKEVRSVTLPKGLASVVIKDVPATLDPTSVRVMARDMVVYDLQYSYNPITSKNLLDKYVGKELTVILPDPADANARILRKAKLVANIDKPIFLVGNEVYVGDYEALLLPELPMGLDAEPVLTLTTKNKAATKKDVALQYLMDGLNWRADYTLTVGAKGDTASLEAWATLTNTSGSDFQGAEVHLVAGDVQRAPSGRTNYQAKRMMVMESSDMVGGSAQSVEKSFSQYHVYDVARPVTLAPMGTRQISLFSASNVKVEQELVSRFTTGGGQQSGELKQDVESALKFGNVAKNNLGRPMPGGLVRVFMPTSDGVQLLAGESGLSHIATGGEVRLALGRSFDVAVERSQSSYQKTGKNSYEVAWSITATNAKATAQSLTLRESFHGQWKILEADRKFKQIDSGTIEFDLADLPPSKDGAGTVVNYTVQVTY
ncbi:MAG: DUF4139 domain-containing protein [Pseudodesulfovibrio sp.]|nr:DUF4139 domain-containing protein [Pseudodesulfovibrio sp.]